MGVYVFHVFLHHECLVTLIINHIIWICSSVCLSISFVCCINSYHPDQRQSPKSRVYIACLLRGRPLMIWGGRRKSRKKNFSRPFSGKKFLGSSHGEKKFLVEKFLRAPPRSLMVDPLNHIK